MSLYGVLRTGVSGMNAQSNKLGTISDNIANGGTIGYKRASTEFSSLLLDGGATSYQSGAVDTRVRHAVSQQGALTYTTSATDLAIEGNGFFIVQGADGQPVLTRAGAFVPDAGTGALVNTAGYALLGYDIRDGGADVVLNGTGTLTPISLTGLAMQATPSTEGTLAVNLPADADVVTGSTPGTGLADATYSEKTSIVAYDDLGAPVVLDIYMTRTAATPATWEYAVYDQADAPAGGGFPYASAALVSADVTFDASGALAGGSPLSFDVPGGRTLSLDLTGTTQLAADFTPISVDVDGNAPGDVSGTSIDSDGTVYASYENGSRLAVYRIPLAEVPSPDGLRPVSGNVFVLTEESGPVQIGFPREGGLGGLSSGALEQSNVDMATELTDMIVAQRDYTANSKVFQTGSELLDVLLNLKR